MQKREISVVLLRQLSELVDLVAQDADFLQQESWYTLEEEIAERKRRVQELGERAKEFQNELAMAVQGVPLHYDSPDNKAWLRANYGVDPIPGDPGYEEWLAEERINSDAQKGEGD